MSEPQFRVAVKPIHGGLRLVGQDQNGNGLWRNGGTYGNSETALAEDTEHDSATLYILRKALRETGYELTSITNLVIIVGCRTSQLPHVAVIVRRVLLPLNIPLDLLRNTPRQ